MQPVERTIHKLHLDAARAIEHVAGGKMLGDAGKPQIEARHQMLAIVFGNMRAEAPGKAPRVSFHVVHEIEHLFRREANQRLAMDLHEFS